MTRGRYKQPFQYNYSAEPSDIEIASYLRFAVAIVKEIKGKIDLPEDIKVKVKKLIDKTKKIA